MNCRLHDGFPRCWWLQGAPLGAFVVHVTAVPKGSPQTHVPALDGLRGIAVLLVIAFHFSWALVGTVPSSLLIKHVMLLGWLGVDMFFVLSGYLISRGLLADSNLSFGARLKAFWMRRVLRIFPLYYAVILIGTLAAFALRARAPELPYWLYLQNYALALDVDPERWTSHLWSLAVEEQFYLVWPLIALAARARRLLSWSLGICAIGIVVRFGLVFVLPKLTSLGSLDLARLAYRATPTRLDGLVLGAFLAAAEREPHARLARGFRQLRAVLLWFSGLALLCTIFATRGFQNEDRRVIVLGYPLVAIFFTCVVSCTVSDDLPRKVGNALSGGVLAQCGRLSYGMYMFHWPMIALCIPLFKVAELRAPLLPFAAVLAPLLGLFTTLLGVALTHLLASLSFRYFEGPFLKLKQRFHG
jgi:peptidoglycan/LPS O-acetylase OafA/YrhL